MVKPSQAPPDGFAAQLLAALTDARLASEQPKPATQLAQAAWNSLQYDFPVCATAALPTACRQRQRPPLEPIGGTPLIALTAFPASQVVSEQELAALVQEYASGRRTALSARFLSVLQENAASAAPDNPAAGLLVASSSSDDDDGDGPRPAHAGMLPAAPASGGGLVPLYQRLYAVAVLQSLHACLAAPDDAAAAAVLGDVVPERVAPTGSDSWLGHVEGEEEGISQLEQQQQQQEAAFPDDGAAGAAAAAELELRLSQQVRSAPMAPEGGALLVSRYATPSLLLCAAPNAGCLICCLPPCAGG